MRIASTTTLMARTIPSAPSRASSPHLRQSTGLVVTICRCNESYPFCNTFVLSPYADVLQVFGAPLDTRLAATPGNTMPISTSAEI